MSDDTRKNPGIKIPFLDINKPLVEGTRCVEVRIPDDDAYMPVLAGLIAIATKWFNWQRDDTHKGTQLAKIWNQAYIITEWGSCMNCEELIACLQPVLDAQTAEIVNQVTNNFTNLQQYGTQTPGEPMTSEQLETDLTEGTNPTCDLDVLWAQSLGIVQFTNRAIEDVFEAIESASNVVELTEVIEQIPFVTYVTNALGIDLANDLANYYQEAVQEGYLAQYTLALEQELACAIFCEARISCTITVDLVYAVFYQRVIALVPDDPVDLVELLSLLAGISVGGTTVVDLMFWFAWAGAKLASFFIGDSLANLFSLQQLLNLAVNDANNDWILLCDCPDCGIGYTLTKGTTLMDDWEECDPPQVAPNLSTFTNAGLRRGTLEFDSPVSTVYLQYNCSDQGGGSLDGMIFRLGEPVVDGLGDWIGWTGGDAFTTAPAQSGEIVVTSPTPQTKFWFDLGYTSPGSESIYNNNLAQIKVLDACE